eukprot:721918_1
MESDHDQNRTKFDVEICLSPLWKDRYLEREEAEEIKEKNEHQIFLIRITRTEGDSLMFNNVKRRFILMHCSSSIRGLPRWARDMQTSLPNISTQNQSHVNPRIEQNNNVEMELSRSDTNRMPDQPVQCVDIDSTNGVTESRDESNSEMSELFTINLQSLVDD